MALPKNLSSISTNMNEIELQEVCAALSKTAQPDIHWLGPAFLMAGMCQGDFMYMDKTYTLTEEYELVISIVRK